MSYKILHVDILYFQIQFTLCAILCLQICYEYIKIRNVFKRH